MSTDTCVDLVVSIESIFSIFESASLLTLGSGLPPSVLLTITRARLGRGESVCPLAAGGARFRAEPDGVDTLELGVDVCIVLDRRAN